MVLGWPTMCSSYRRQRLPTVDGAGNICTPLQYAVSKGRNQAFLGREVVADEIEYLSRAGRDIGPDSCKI